MLNILDLIMEKTQDTRFKGIERLYGLENFMKLTQAHVLVVGLGGVGSWAAEALARSGIGEITLVDLDEICVSNINRQVHSLDSTVGQLKIEVLKIRLLQINPNLKINLVVDFFGETNAEEILSHKYDCVIDAIDSLKAKCILIAACKKREIPIIVTGAAGGKIDPSQIVTCDLAKSINDNLLFRVRKKLTQEFNFPRGKNRKFHIDCVFSKEFVRDPIVENCDTTTSDKLDCAGGLGSISFITGSFGFHAVALAIKKILNEN